MSDENSIENEGEVETRLEPQAHGGSLQRKEKPIDPVAERMYGKEHFTGYMKVAQLVDLLPSFKEFYYAEKIKDDKKTAFSILREFNEGCYANGTKFHPYPTQYRQWRMKWDRDIMEQKMDKDIVIYEPKKIKQVIKTRGENGELVLGGNYNELEAGVTTLAGELINDAAQMLRDDQELEDIYDTEELIKRRSYIVNVFAHTTKLVHGKAALMLKASQEKRENASFLMTLLAKASAGKLSDEEMATLETTYSKQNEQPATV